MGDSSPATDNEAGSGGSRSRARGSLPHPKTRGATAPRTPRPGPIGALMVSAARSGYRGAGSPTGSDSRPRIGPRGRERNRPAGRNHIWCASSFRPKIRNRIQTVSIHLTSSSRPTGTAIRKMRLIHKHKGRFRSRLRDRANVHTSGRHGLFLGGEPSTNATSGRHCAPCPDHSGDFGIPKQSVNPQRHINPDCSLARDERSHIRTAPLLATNARTSELPNARS